MNSNEPVKLIISNSFLRSVITYHCVLYCIFLIMYMTIVDFDQNFYTPHKTPGTTTSISTISYYIIATQTTVMCEIVPRTALARSLQTTHTLLSWFVIILSMSPIDTD